jgi:hypothetical protein
MWSNVGRARTPDYKEFVEKNWNDRFEGARNLQSI